MECQRQDVLILAEANATLNNNPSRLNGWLASVRGTADFYFLLCLVQCLNHAVSS
jgi:hypothetical protein